jgi:prepilin-type processing-associated H-X9-DG protein
MKSLRQEPRSAHSTGFTVIELVVVVSVIAVLMGVLLPAVQQARENARKFQCRNNLMNIGFAVQSYSHTFGRLPPGSVNDTAPVLSRMQGYHMSWIAQLLPYLEHSGTYRKFDFGHSVYAKANAVARATRLGVLLCSSASVVQTVLPFQPGTAEDPSFVPPPGAEVPPSIPMDQWASEQRITCLSHYAGCHHDSELPIDVDQHGVLFLNSGVRWRDITDGRACTIAVGEVTSDLLRNAGWIAGTRATLRNTGLPINQPAITAPGMPADTAAWTGNWELTESQAEELRMPVVDYSRVVGGFGSVHLGGAHFLFADGSVRFLAANIDFDTYRQMGHRSDGELSPEE